MKRWVHASKGGLESCVGRGLVSFVSGFAAQLPPYRPPATEETECLK